MLVAIATVVQDRCGIYRLSVKTDAINPFTFSDHYSEQLFSSHFPIYLCLMV